MSTRKIEAPTDGAHTEPLRTDANTSTGIIMPDTAKEKPQKGFRDRYWSRRHRLDINSNTRG